MLPINFECIIVLSQQVTITAMFPQIYHCTMKVTIQGNNLDLL